MIKVYYMEDDENIALPVKEYLEERGCTVSVICTLAEGRDAFEHGVPDIVLMDWNMPDGEGNSLCRRIRSVWRELPIIFLTVRGDTHDIVSGFGDGADDYAVKPFELEVLYSRIKALLRRAGSASERYLSCGPVGIDKNRVKVFTGRRMSFPGCGMRAIGR